MSSKYSYNSWPLGKLPDDWQRPEPMMILKKGYAWEDPRDIVDIFEKKLASFSGAKYAVTTDSASSAIFLCLKYRNFLGTISLPKQTYISVPMQVIHSGAMLALRDEEWEGTYHLNPVGIIDGAGRFRKNMYQNKDSLHCLSFQIKKRLPIGKGGAILTDSYEAWEWLKLASYDGRDLTSPYDSQRHIKMLGWHCYMTPEDAARGILLMDNLPSTLPDTMSFRNYPDLSEISAIQNYL